MLLPSVKPRPTSKNGEADQVHEQSQKPRQRISDVYQRKQKSWLPASGVRTPRYEDWVWRWQSGRFSTLALGGVAPYLNVTSSNYSILLCPSDDPTFRVRAAGYPVSYTMNWMTTSYSVANNNVTLMPNGKIYPKITDIPHTSQTIMILEEDQSTIDDGQSSIWLQAPSWSAVNLLAIRHDRARSYPDTPATGLSLNGKCRGNVGFCDGHVEFVSRWFCASKSNAVPVPSDFPNDPETDPPGP